MDNLLNPLSENPEYSIGFIVSLFIFVFSTLSYNYNSTRKLIKNFKDNFRGSPKKNIIHKYFEECCEKNYTTSKEIVFIEDPVVYVCKKIQSEFKHKKSYRFGGYFTGISLIFTFLMIGQAVYKIGNGLPDIGGAPATETTAKDATTSTDSKNPHQRANDNSANSSPGSSQINIKEKDNKTKDAMVSLGKAIADLRTKFWVSVLGIFFSIIFQLLASYYAALLFRFTFRELAFLRDVGKLHSYMDLDCQLQQFDVLNKIPGQLQSSSDLTLQEMRAIKGELSNLQEIDVKVGDLTENVTQQLKNVIDHSVGLRLTALLDAQREATDRIASSISKALAESIGKELETSFAKLAEILPNVVMGGAAQSSQKVAQTFDKISDTLPGLIENLNNVVVGLQSSQRESFDSSRKINEQLLLTIQQSIERFNSATLNNVTDQSELVSRLNRSIELLTEKSKEGVKENQEVFVNGGKIFHAGVIGAGNALQSTVNSLKTSLTEIDSLSANLKNTNVAIINQVNQTVYSLNETLNQSKTLNEQFKNSISALANISKTLTAAPENTRNIIIETKAFTDKFETSALNLQTSYAEGIEQLTRVFAAKIKQVQEETKNIEKAYSGAGQGLAEALGPLEDLSDNIENLNKTLKETRLK